MNQATAPAPLEIYVDERELRTRTQGRQTVLFGTGNACRHTCGQIEPRPAYIIDNNPALQNTEFCGLPVKPPETLRNGHDPRPLVVICTSAVQSILAQLRGFGLQPVRDVLVSPAFLDMRVIEELESRDVDLLFASGTPVADSSQWGGGIYRLQRRAGTVTYEKAYSGFCYGIARRQSEYFAVDHHRGLVKFDAALRPLQIHPMPEGARGHGIAFWDRENAVVVAATYLDQLLLFDSKLAPRGVIEISDRHRIVGQPCHHINDIVAVGDTLYVSMFSVAGKWHESEYDGAIIAIDLSSPERREIVADGLRMPHSLFVRDGTLYYLESLGGELRTVEGGDTIGRFPGFTRGLEWDGRFFYVGQSKNRHHRHIREQSLNTSIDVSIITFDQESRVSQSMPLPRQVSEIHALASVAT